MAKGSSRPAMGGDLHRSALLKDSDPEMLQDLILSAVNLALDQSRVRATEMLGPLAGGLPGQA